MIRINLLPVKAAQKKEMLKGQLLVAALTLVVTLGLCGLLYMQVLGKVQEKREQIEAKRFEISKLMKTIGEVKQFEKKQAELKAKLDVLAQLKEARTGPVHLLDALYQTLPDEVWLTKFKEGGGNVSLSGVGVSEESVALFMRNLERSDQFRNVELKVTQQNVQGGVKFQKFDITCKAVRTSPDIQVADQGKGKGKAPKKRAGGT
ncbi:MAG: PilN domain-containing protein [Desulfuromonadales bacterium]|nr:PilN domain-containing protein [Desulfuromonadales bacterium]